MGFPELQKHNTTNNYGADRETISQFLLFYSESGTPKYLQQLGSSVININIEDIAVFDQTGLSQRIKENTLSYLNLIYEIIDSYLFENEQYNQQAPDPFITHRIARIKEKHPEKQISEIFPAALIRNYTVNFLCNSEILPLREVKSENIGEYVRIRGIITKIGSIKPNIKVVTYICDSCGSETYQEIIGDVFNPLDECPSDKCRIRNVKGTLSLQTRGSKFINHQVVRIQELTSDVPVGAVPRSMNCVCYADNTAKCRPGDGVVVGGVFLPKKYTGMKRLKAGLLTDTYLSVMSIEKKEKTATSPKEFSPEKIVSAFAPEIFGHSDIKKILLLMLVGSPSIEREDGAKIRGEINVLLVGDPGIAKSQLLKTVAKISDRGVYTTGKGSSGVGLTATVTKDPVTGEMVLEGGALVLSDKGVCCIDELDKMEDYDRVGIHEVMEQQRVSINKAGINTTLNARCSILGAANPVRGRYDISKSVEYNVGLQVSLLSRFDILAVIRDLPEMEYDLNLAKHITQLHIKKPEEIDYSHIRAHIQKSKTINPTLSLALKERLVLAYVEARKELKNITPRYLLSLTRISLAHARLRHSQEVTNEDVDEALRLVKLSKTNVKIQRKKKDSKYEIYNLILNMSKEVREGEREIAISEVLKQTRDKYPEKAITDIINEFVSIGVWREDGEKIYIYN